MKQQQRRHRIPLITTTSGSKVSSGSEAVIVVVVQVGRCEWEGGREIVTTAVEKDATGRIRCFVSHETDS